MTPAKAAPSAPISNRPLPPAPGPELARDVLKEGRVQCLVSGQWTDVFLVLRSGGGLDLFRGQEATGPKLDQLGLTLAHCAVSLQSSVSYNEVNDCNHNRVRPNSRCKRFIGYVFTITLKARSLLTRAFSWRYDIYI